MLLRFVLFLREKRYETSKSGKQKVESAQWVSLICIWV